MYIYLQMYHTEQYPSMAQFQPNSCTTGCLCVCVICWTHSKDACQSTAAGTDGWHACRTAKHSLAAGGGVGSVIFECCCTHCLLQMLVWLVVNLFETESLDTFMCTIIHKFLWQTWHEILCFISYCWNYLNLTWYFLL